MIAALFVERDGCYFGLPGVDPWDKIRDARNYSGRHPVVAHPPCERWGRYWGGHPRQYPRLILGDDGGCFAAALKFVRRHGGVLEHPEGSHAWRTFGLNVPPRSGGWVAADWHGGWTCCVEQGFYGHRARKATWLYAHSVELPSLRWGRAPGDFVRLDEGFHSKEERARAVKTGACQRLSKRQRAATPFEFRDLLISIAHSALPSGPAPDGERNVTRVSRATAGGDAPSSPPATVSPPLPHLGGHAGCPSIPSSDRGAAVGASQEDRHDTRVIGACRPSFVSLSRGRNDAAELAGAAVP